MSKKPQPPWNENWWAAIIFLVVLAAVMVWLLFAGSAKGADINILWDANDPRENVTKYVVRVDEVFGLASFTGETPGTSITLGGLTRGRDYIVTVVAVNSIGVSEPTILSHRLKFKFRIRDFRGDVPYVGTEYHSREILSDKPREFYWQSIEAIP